ncbi:TPA: ImmA/IrrE family metallo-endopeptidase, partial [Streptococcus pyogenes MGAS10029]|nr:ImmA/IrrE family metallo-endopeptidase [Streptococcus pyogenes MGAS10029]
MSVSTKQLVQTYGYELVFYDDRGADKKAFANHECKVIGIGSYL